MLSLELSIPVRQEGAGSLFSQLGSENLFLNALLRLSSAPLIYIMPLQEA